MNGVAKENVEYDEQGSFVRLLAERKAKLRDESTRPEARRPNAGASAERRKREAKQVSKTDGRRKSERREKQINVKVTERERDEFYALAKARKVSGRELYLDMLIAWKEINGV